MRDTEKLMGGEEEDSIIRPSDPCDAAAALASEEVLKTKAAHMLRTMDTVEDLYAAWGRGDFWIVSPCRSVAVRYNWSIAACSRSMYSHCALTVSNCVHDCIIAQNAW